MAAPTISVSADSLEESFREMIEIGVDVTYPMHVTLAVFPASTIVMRLAQHEDAIWGIKEHLLEVPIREELRALRDWLNVVEAERATLRATVRTIGAVETSLRNRIRDESQTRIKIERQMALVQEELTQSRMSHSQDRENFKKLEDFMINHFGYYPWICYFMIYFFAQPPNTPNTLVDKKDSDLDEILDDLFRTRAENLRRMDICEQDVGLEKKKAQVKYDDDDDIYDIWDIKVKNIEPPTTKSILDKLLEEFRYEILNVTMVDEEANFNPTKDIEELERLLAKNTQSHFTKIHVHSVIVKPEPFIHTQPMSPLYGVIKSSQSSTYPYKVDRDITSHEWF
ncbi:hypothetical protein Tco_1474282 [Tanacetum coccineum]